MKPHLSKSPGHKINAGTIVFGKWYQKQYQIIKSLGFGAQGTVYLAQSEQGKVALKFGNENATITSEVNVLKRLEKVQGEPLGPCLYDVDDWLTNRGKLSFYAMEFIQGRPLLETVSSRGFEWAPIFMMQLLGDLSRLHDEGLVFGDLKPENLMVTSPRLRIRWLDVGGVTLIGRSIKEYTEFYDRGYWGMGSRKADPAYDLFAASMIFIQMATMKRFDRGREPGVQLENALHQSSKLKPFAPVLKKAIDGEYTNADAMRTDFVHSMNKSRATRQTSAISQDTPKRSREKSSWKGTVLLGSALGVGYFVYVTFFIM